MRLKYYLRGLGIGIIGAAIILAISFSINNKSIQENSTPPVAEIAESGAENNVDSLENEGSEKLSDLEKKDDAESFTPDDTEDDEDSSLDDNADDEESDVLDETKPEADKPAKTPEKETVEKFEIMVAPGEYSDTICKKLERAGIIDDATGFNTYLNKNKYDNKLQPGVFLVEKGLSYEELAEILTSKAKK